MELNSCLYETNIMHCRTRPKKHKFNHKIFMFYLDLDELDRIDQELSLVGCNRKAFYSFRDEDHFEEDGLTIKEKVRKFLKVKNFQEDIGKIMLLTNLRTFGHLFNPVSFYFCFDKDKNPVCVIPEIGNTFGEIKPFLLDKNTLSNGRFSSQQKKYYYISPFIDLDIPLDFNLAIPGEYLKISIDDFDDQGKFLYATMSGKRKELSDKNLWKYTLMFPFVTLKVIGLIHFHALLLWLKKVPYHEKTSNMELQKEVYRAWNKN